MVIGPGPLRTDLIGVVVGVGLELPLLPAPPALTLTGCQAAITLLWNLRTRPEGLAAGRAPPTLHGWVSAHKKRGAWATRSVGDNRAEVHRDPTGRKEISGSTFMSTSGSVPESAEDWAVHCFPGARFARDIWGRVVSQPATEDPSSLPAYQAAQTAGLDPCGVLRLASRTVGVPFVGITAAAMVIGELLRRIHGGQSFDALAATMTSLDDLECVPALVSRPWMHGCAIAR